MKKGRQQMTVSSLAIKTIISPNKSKRTHKIDTITLHCMACNGSLDAIGKAFQKSSTKASSNYGVDSKGRVACYVPEEYRSWCSSSTSNDNRAITIEIANDGGANTGWHSSDKAIQGTIELVTDVCKRNGIKQLKWKANKALVGKIDQQNMTVHRWFKNKACPGDYIYNLHGYIADEVNKRLGNAYKPTATSCIANGVDWQNVFDAKYYSDRYDDLRRAFGTDEKKLLDHFLQFGMNEQRQAKADFDVKIYRQRYMDLQLAFGDNWYSYYWHFCLCGKKEGRKGV
jgi:hypothetical protein